MMIAVLSLVVLAGPLTLDVKVDGAGYMRFVSEGRVVYANSAQLTVVGGSLGHKSGALVLPTIKVPATAPSLSIDLEGRVFVGEANVGRLVLAVFGPSDALTPSGSFLVAANRPKLSNPGEGLAGVIRMGGETPVPQTEPAKTIKPVNKVTRSGKATIVVSGDSEASGERFLLGEIAQISAAPELTESLKSIEIGDTPSIGVSRGLDVRQIAARLKAEGFDVDELSIEIEPGSKVHRKAQLIPAADFERVAVEAARQALGDTVPLIAQVSRQEFKAPMGTLELVAESCVTNSGGASVLIAVKIDGRRYNARQIQVKPDAQAPGVRFGSPITILMVSGGATVEVSGQAKGNAFVGQTVTVKTSTGVEFTGTVVSPGRVEVKL
jgi:hypothetical protein